MRITAPFTFLSTSLLLYASQFVIVILAVPVTVITMFLQPVNLRFLKVISLSAPILKRRLTEERITGVLFFLFIPSKEITLPIRSISSIPSGRTSSVPSKSKSIVVAVPVGVSAMIFINEPSVLASITEVVTVAALPHNVPANSARDIKRVLFFII